MELPNGPANPNREFSGQKFVHHKAHGAEWQPHDRAGFEARDTTIAENTGDVAGVQVLRRGSGDSGWAEHDADIHFTFVLEGGMELHAAGHSPVTLRAGDAFVVPPAMATWYADPSDDLELLEVTLPGRVNTRRSETP